MAKDKDLTQEAEGDAPATMAGMSAERFAQFARLQALRTAEMHGRVHGKGRPAILQDATVFAVWVMTGELPKDEQIKG